MKYLFFCLVYFNLIFLMAAEPTPSPPTQPTPQSTPQLSPGEVTTTVPIPPPPTSNPDVASPALPMPSFPQQNQSDNQATVVPAEVIPDKFQYDPTVGRDPFKIPIVNVDKFKSSPVINEDSLEGAPIPNGVKVLAIMYDSKKPRALVRKLSNGKSYAVFNKSRLGEGGGIVSEIREDEIVVVRSVETEGQTVIENIVLRLKDKKRKIDSK